MTTNDLLIDLKNGLGALVMWELAETRITPDDLRTVLASHGEDPSVVPDIDPAGAVRRAAREWRVGQGNATRYRSEVVYDSNGRIDVGLLRRERLGDHEVQWVQVATMVYGIRHGRPVLDDAVGTDIQHVGAVASLVDGYATHLDHTWIRPNLVQAKLAGMGAVNWRRGGGVVFVPAAYLRDLDRLARVVRSIGSSVFDVAHLANTEDSRASVSRATRDHLTEQISEVGARLDEWAKSDRKIASHSVASVLEQIGEVTLRGDLYAQALGVAMDDLRAKVDAARERARGLLMGVGVEAA